MAAVFAIYPSPYNVVEIHGWTIAKVCEKLGQRRVDIAALNPSANLSVRFGLVLTMTHLD